MKPMDKKKPSLEEVFAKGVSKAPKSEPSIEIEVEPEEDMEDEELDEPSDDQVLAMKAFDRATDPKERAAALREFVKACNY